jgi:predicted dehydrogenase
MMQNDIWLVGTGAMAVEYAKVLKALGCSYMAIGRGQENCEKFLSTTGVPPIRGGLQAFLQTAPPLPSCAIVAVGIEALAEATIQLMEYGVKLILLEKPGVGAPTEIYGLTKLAGEKNARVLLAYNRRFYSSVLRAKSILAEDEGLTSFQFEFTEWSHVIRPLKKHPAEHHNWFLGNSTHVIDTAFYLGGVPSEWCAYVKGGLDWHPASSVFAGAGITVSGALFSYSANWEAPGRWVLELLSKKHRLIFRPMESLQIQKIGSVVAEPVELDDSLDKEFKPGLYLQTKTFLEGDFREFCDIHAQQERIGAFYLKMSGY